jgi:hypothetical protein
VGEEGGIFLVQITSTCLCCAKGGGGGQHPVKKTPNLSQIQNKISHCFCITYTAKDMAKNHDKTVENIWLACSLS